MPLPPPRQPGRYVVGLVCLGNICRSPMAQVVLEQRLARAGLDDRVSVESSGTGDWHVGEPMDPRAASALTTAGYDASRHRARHYVTDWPDSHHLVLAMDSQNLADIGGPTDRIMMFRDFDPVDPGADVPDPWYGGSEGFTDVLATVERTCDALVTELTALLD